MDQENGIKMIEKEIFELESFIKGTTTNYYLKCG
jgi:hypothetical protein